MDILFDDSESDDDDHSETEDVAFDDTDSVASHDGPPSEPGLPTRHAAGAAGAGPHPKRLAVASLPPSAVMPGLPAAPVPIEQTLLSAFLRPVRWLPQSQSTQLPHDILVELCDGLLREAPVRVQTIACVCRAWRAAALEALEAVRARLAAAGAALRAERAPRIRVRTAAIEAVRHAGIGMEHNAYTDMISEVLVTCADKGSLFRERHSWQNPYTSELCRGGRRRPAQRAFVRLCRHYGVSAFRCALMTFRIEQCGFFPTRMSAWGCLRDGCELCGETANLHPASLRPAPLLVPSCRACVRARAVWVELSVPGVRTPPNVFTVDDVAVRPIIGANSQYAQRSVGTLVGLNALARARRARPSKVTRAKTAIGRCAPLHHALARSNIVLRGQTGAGSGSQFDAWRPLRTLLWTLPPPLNATVGQADCSLYAMLRISRCDDALRRAQLKAERAAARDKQTQHEQALVKPRLMRQFVVFDPARPSRNVSIRGVYALYQAAIRFGMHTAAELAWGDSWEFAPLLGTLRSAVLMCALAGRCVPLSEKQRRAVLQADEWVLFESVRRLWQVFNLVWQSPRAAGLDVPDALDDSWMRFFPEEEAGYEEGRLRQQAMQNAVGVLRAVSTSDALSPHREEAVLLFIERMRQVDLRIDVSPLPDLLERICRSNVQCFDVSIAMEGETTLSLPPAQTPILQLCGLLLGDEELPKELSWERALTDFHDALNSRDDLPRADDGEPLWVRNFIGHRSARTRIFLFNRAGVLAMMQADLEL